MSGSQADAEDLAQETFLQAYRHAGSFRGEAKVSSWLYRIALNRCLNWRKGQARREELLRAWVQESAVEAGGAGSARGQNAERVQGALLQLDPKQRAAIVLTVYDGLSHGEAARALGCSEATVSWRVFMARRKLKQLLKHLSGGADE